MSCGATGERRVVTLEVLADSSEEYDIMTVPLADPVAVITVSGRGYVTVDLAAGDAWGTPEGYSFGDFEGAPVALVVPRSASGIRVRCDSQVSASVSIALLEES